MRKKARLLTHPTLAASSPSRPEPAKTGLLPKDAPFRRQGRSKRRGEQLSRMSRPLCDGRVPLSSMMHHRIENGQQLGVVVDLLRDVLRGGIGILSQTRLIAR